MEEAYRELQALLECADNHKRIVLLQNIYRGDRRYYWLRKRAIDLLASTLGLLVLSPVLLLIALAILIDDPKGSPFFKQTRVGRHNKEPHDARIMRFILCSFGIYPVCDASSRAYRCARR